MLINWFWLSKQCYAHLEQSLIMNVHNVSYENEMWKSLGKKLAIVTALTAAPRPGCVNNHKFCPQAHILAMLKLNISILIKLNNNSYHVFKLENVIIVPTLKTSYLPA